MAHASLISLDVAETLPDSLFRGHSRFSADGIAMRMRGLNTRRPFAETAESTRDKFADGRRSLKRAGQSASVCRWRSGDEMQVGRHQWESGAIRTPTRTP